MSLLRPYSNAMGIDVSDQVVRMVQIVPKGRKFSLRSISARPLPDNTIVEGEVRDQKTLSTVLRDLIAKPHHRHPSTRSAIICLPERKTFTKIIEVPIDPSQPFSTSLQQGLVQNIPMKLDEAYVDWQYVAPPQPKDKSTRVIVSVAPQLLVEGYISAFQAAGIIPIVFEPESAALSRVVLNVAAINGGHMIVDLGATRTGIIISEGDLVAYASTMPLSGSGLTALLQTKLGLTFEEAEQAKRICGLDPKRGKGAVRSILEAEFRPLFQRMLEVISYYEEHAPKDAKVQDITLVGGGSQLLGLGELVQSTLSLPVQIGSWPKNVSTPTKDVQAIGPSYLTALGLALRGAQQLPLTAPKEI